MTRRTRGARHVALFIAVAFATGCGAAESTQQAPVADDPSTTPFSVYTHCGVENVRIDGRWWHAEPPLYNQDRSGPPEGWGDPHQDGTLTMVAPDRAVFEALGQRVVFVPAPENEPVRVCR
jgi:hypothetical protein